MRKLAWLAAALLPALVACSNGDDMNSGYRASALVSDGPVRAAQVDARLVNPWGIAFNPVGFVWVANNGSNTSTLYDGNGVPQTLVVSIPAGSRGAAAPTGIVFNGSSDFVVSAGGLSGPAPFIFDGEGGTLSAWSPTVNRLNAITVYDDGAGGAVYKGLAIASNGGANTLYAADFHNNKIDVFNASFAKLTLATGSFVDPQLPTGYAPFGIQAIGSRIYVAYALKQTGSDDEVAGPGLGVLAAFNTDGSFVAQLVGPNGALNAPWGIAMAPPDYGAFSNALLVGNFGDGSIHAFNATTGEAIGALTAADGSRIVLRGLWGIAFGNGLNGQPTNTLFYAAGANDEANGVYGRIDFDPNASGPICTGYGC